MKRKMQNSRRKNAGFTLVETLVAIAILSLAITGPLVIAEKGLSSALYSQDQVIATYLAQDAIEYVRNVRDTNILNSQPWLKGLDDCTNGNSCQIDTTGGDDNIASYNASSVLKLDSNGLYNYTSGTNTIFTRKVTITNVVENQEVQVTVQVSWQANIFVAPQSVIISEHLFNL